MHALSHIVSFLSTASLGLFAGAMLTEGLVLLPMWRAQSATEFFAWYGANAQRLLDFFGPLTWTAGLLALAAAVTARWSPEPVRAPAIVAALCMAAAVLTFPLYFGHTNTSFARATLAPAALPAELARWAVWHWARTGFSLAALAAGLTSLYRLRG